MTYAMVEALRRAVVNGAVFAGADVQGGRVVRTSGSTIAALARRGLVTVSTSPDGGVMARPTEKGRLVAGGT